MKRILVIAPHPDDEVLGVGGTIARGAAEGSQIYVVIVTKGFAPAFDEELVAQGRREAAEAHATLGVHRAIFLDLPAAGLDSVEHRLLNERLSGVIHDLKPDVLYIPFNGDIHLDHQMVFASAMVAARPNGSYTPRSIYAYETLSETNWNAPYLTPAFVPNVFVDIADYLGVKIAAMEVYRSQIKDFPHERSTQAMRALAALRGSAICRPAAEGFVLVREIV
jgi:N-acetylglucosamine malate deacetylase 1